MPDDLALPAARPAARDPLPDGGSGPAADRDAWSSVGSLEPVLAAEGVVQAETYLQPGDTIRPVQVDGDRRGYVIAVADSPDEALARADAAAALLDVEVAA